MPKLSFVVPALNEADNLRACLEPLQYLREQGHEIIVVDGGSTDATVDRAAGLADRVLHSEPGRAVQMNLGAACADGDLLVFLHADTFLGADAVGRLASLDDDTGRWGRFDVHLSGAAWPLRIIERLMNLRSRVTGIATGDQAIFVSRTLFERVRGYPEIPIMEDLELSGRLHRVSPPICLRERVITSSRRWEAHGIWRTIWKMWWLRLRYFLGAEPVELAREYDAL